MSARDVWDGSPALRAAVEQRLIDWGWHMYGGETRLGYPSHTPWSGPPKRGYQSHYPEHSPDDADHVHHVLTSAAQASRTAMRNAQVLRLAYCRRDLPMSEKARRLGCSRRTFTRRLDDALFWSWRVLVVFDDTK